MAQKPSIALLLLNFAAASPALAQTQITLSEPAAFAEPRIFDAPISAIRPGTPFLYSIAAVGVEPLSYAADGLPAGLSIDTETA